MSCAGPVRGMGRWFFDEAAEFGAIAVAHRHLAMQLAVRGETGITLLDRGLHTAAAQHRAVAPAGDV